MKKEPKIFLKHIQESIEEIENYARKISEDEFWEDAKTQDAIIRRIEIIGEAVKNLPLEFKRRHPEIEWHEIAGMRDKLIHGYFEIDLDIVFETVKKDIPKLKKQVTELLENFRV